MTSVAPGTHVSCCCSFDRTAARIWSRLNDEEFFLPVEQFPVCRDDAMAKLFEARLLSERHLDSPDLTQIQ